MPANGSGLWDYSKFSLARFGIVDWDQSVNLVRWARSQPWDASSTMLEQAAVGAAAAARAGNPLQRSWVYRSAVKLITYLPQVRPVLTDPSFAPWFLRYATTSPVNPACDYNFHPPRCSVLFHDSWGLPIFPSNATISCAAPGCDCGAELPCGEYYPDFRRWTDTPIAGQTLRDWWIRNCR
jgi:hypothetical protein